MLDTSFPYGTETVKVEASKTETIDNNDSPGSRLDGKTKYKKVSDQDKFETYLMFKPEGADSIWVSLRVTKWGWQGEAIKDKKGKWSFGADPPPKASKDPKSEATNSLPTWQKNYTDLRFK